jgi:hypothetical protein
MSNSRLDSCRRGEPSISFTPDHSSLAAAIIPAASYFPVALWTLVAGRDQSVPFLKEKLRPVKLDARLSQRIAQLISELDSEEFTVRTDASAELAKVGALAEPALKEVLMTKPSLEVQRRVEALLELMERNRWQGVARQSWRALAVLERIGNDDARQVLEGLAKGDPDARLTQEADLAVQRLQRRK